VKHVVNGNWMWVVLAAFLMLPLVKAGPPQAAVQAFTTVIEPVDPFKVITLYGQ
jgi:hypothetical protein